MLKTWFLHTATLFVYEDKKNPRCLLAAVYFKLILILQFPNCHTCQVKMRIGKLQVKTLYDKPFKLILVFILSSVTVAF